MKVEGKPLAQKQRLIEKLPSFNSYCMYVYAVHIALLPYSKKIKTTSDTFSFANKKINANFQRALTNSYCNLYKVT